MTSALHLYLDETGSFDSNDERCAIGGLQTRTPPSRVEIEAFWREVLGELPSSFHATEHRDDALGDIITRLIAGMRARGWFPVVFEHTTRAFIVDNATTYACVMAEGIVRLGRLATNTADPPRELRITAATRSAPDASGYKQFMYPGTYVSRIEERLGVERARASAHARELDWTWRIDFADALRDPVLWIADALCNAWRRVKKLPTPTRQALREFLAPHTVLVLQSDDVERVSLLVGRHDYGLALLDLLSLTVSNPQARGLAQVRTDLVTALTRLDARGLESALGIPLGWIEQAVNARDHKKAERCVHVFETQVLDALEEQLPAPRKAEVTWARAQALTHALSSANHRGAVVVADEVLARLRVVRAGLTHQFERLPLVISGQFAEAVHRSNTYDFTTTLSDMQRLGESLRDLVEFFETVVDDASGPLRSDAVGRAFGTALQAACHLARREPARYDEARALSDRAIVQFANAHDRSIQNGYRCQIETDAGDLDAALARWRAALGMDDGVDLKGLVKASAVGPWFNLMHAARIWEAAARLGNVGLAQALGKAWEGAGVAALAYVHAPHPHPHGVILWKWGAALGHLGKEKQAFSRLDAAIASLESNPEHITLRTLALGARAERLALRVEGPRKVHDEEARDLERCWSHLSGARWPERQRAWLAPWREVFDAARDRSDVARLRAGWRRLARDIPY